MAQDLVPIGLFLLASTLVAVGMLMLGRLLGPRRVTLVKEMPYESGMDPIHDASRRFDIRFQLVAIAFIVFDVELLFLYPWAVALKHANGVEAAVQTGLIASRGLVFGGVLTFIALMVLGLAYDWRKGLFRWR